MARQQHRCFDIYKPGGHLQKFAGDFQVVLPHRVNIGQILLEQRRNLNIADIELMLLNQIQKQIERAFKFARLKLRLFHAHRIIPAITLTKPVRKFSPLNSRLLRNISGTLSAPLTTSTSRTM